MDDVFDDLWQLRRPIGSRGGFRPAVDVYRREDPSALVVVVELAGVDSNDVEIAVAGGQLAVVGRRRRPAGGKRVMHLEIEHGEFRRQIQLPEDVDASAATAEFDRGLLTIILPIVARAAVQRSVTITMTRTA